MDSLARNKGFSIIEILIAMALMIMIVVGVISSSGGFGSTLAGYQSSVSDSEVNSEALHKAQDLIEKASAIARSSYSSVATSTTLDGIYKKYLTIPTAYTTQCQETIAGTVTWTGTQNRVLSVTATTTIVDVPNMIALGGACDTTPPEGTWNPPVTYNCTNFNPGKPTGIDVLSKIVYMTSNHSPYFYINDTTGAVSNPSCQAAQSPPFSVFANGFAAEGQLNDVRVSRSRSNGRVYAYVARDASTKQFQVIDVTDIHNPTLIASSTLASASGSFPQGFRVFYYDNKAYISTRETAGNEFHVYGVATPGTPSSIAEIGTGFAINRTIESFAVTKIFHAGEDHYYAYMATDKNSAELTVLDITFPTPTTATYTEITYPDQDLPGNQDGGSVILVGNRLYLGRLSGGVSELFVFDASQPWNGLKIIAQQDIGTSVIGLAVSGRYAFLATTQASNEFKVYRSDPFNLIAVNTNFNFPNLLENGVRYSDNYVYVASTGNDALRILYSP